MLRIKRFFSWTASVFLIISLCCSCQSKPESSPTLTVAAPAIPTDPYLVVLGIAQDAGYPQAGCSKDCCKDVWGQLQSRKLVTCLGLLDPLTDETWLFEATPDFRDQLFRLNAELDRSTDHLPEGIFLTHAHLGHYTGLMHLGHEAMGANQVPVWAMPRMKAYLENNGPWSQLVKLKNIELRQLSADSLIHLNDRLSVRPLQVPHRDEYSETVGYQIIGPQRKALFIPDIDKWERWERDIRVEIAEVDWAFLDGTFYQNGEIPGRDMALIPHPFIEESQALFSDLPKVEKEKIFFIHFNHTNPILRPGAAQKSLQAAGLDWCREGERFEL